MSRNPDSTLPSQRIPAVVVIAPEGGLVATCESMARALEEAPRVIVTDVAGASNTVAAWRPFVLVVPQPVFAFDPREFESLAQTVGAEVLVVPAGEPPSETEARLGPRLSAALSWWQARGAVSP